MHWMPGHLFKYDAQISSFELCWLQKKGGMTGSLSQDIICTEHYAFSIFKATGQNIWILHYNPLPQNWSGWASTQTTWKTQTQNVVTLKFLLDGTLEQSCINTGFLEQTRCAHGQTAIRDCYNSPWIFSACVESHSCTCKLLPFIQD